MIDRYLLILPDASFPVAHTVFVYFVGLLSHVGHWTGDGSQRKIALCNSQSNTTDRIFTMTHRNDDVDDEDGDGVEEEEI